MNVKQLFSITSALLLTMFVGVANLSAAEKQAESIDELVAMFDESKCVECHEATHSEWQSSWHSRAVISSLKGMHNFIAIGLAKEWETPLTKAQVMKCLDCHAPTVKYASEKLAVEIGNMIVTAHKMKGTSKGDAAKKELAKLNVGCLACHNVKAGAVARGLHGEPKPGMIYGPNGDDADDGHETEELVDITRASFCMQCHGKYKAVDGETIQCNTLSGSYQNTYIAKGGSKTCQDCHMKKGHTFPGGHDLDIVTEGLGLQVEIVSYGHLPGTLKKKLKEEKKWIPSAVVNVFIENKTGHRVPDG
jgi:Outer membrane cytochrome MtrC/MtrF-like, domains II/IV